MIRTRGGHQFKPGVQTRTNARDGTSTFRASVGHSPTQGAEAPPDLSPAIALMQSSTSTDILKEPQGAEPPSKRYSTRVRPRPPPPPPPPPPSPVHPRPPRRAPPFKRAWTSGPGESSRSRSEPSETLAAQSPTTSSSQLSPASRIRRPLFHCDSIPGNVDCHAKDFHGESYYDIPALEADPWF